MNITSEFPTWEILSSFPGAVAMILALTQLTKGRKFIDSIPTQVWSYILALFVLYPATYFTGGLTADVAFLIIFKAVGVSLTANGGYTAANRFLGKPTATDGELLIDTANPEKHIYRIELGENLEKLGEKKTIVLDVHPGADLSQ